MSSSFIIAEINRCIITLVIILIQITCYDSLNLFDRLTGYPDQYEVQDYYHTALTPPTPEKLSNMSDYANGIYIKIPANQTVSAPVRQELNSRWKFGTLHPSHIAWYKHNNNSNSEFFVVKGSTEFKWCLKPSFPVGEYFVCGISHVNGLFTVNDDQERFTVVNWAELDEIIKDNKKYLNNLRELFPYFPPEYRVDLRGFGFVTQAKKYCLTRGLYQKNEDDHQIEVDSLSLLKDAWYDDEDDYEVDAKNVKQYDHEKHEGYMLFVMEDARAHQPSYCWALITPDAVMSGTKATSSELFAFDGLYTIELMIYDSSIQMMAIAQVHNISIRTIYVMMILSVCFVLMVLGIGIKAWCGRFAQTVEPRTSPYNIRRI